MKKKKRNKVKAFQNIDAIFKINSIDFSFFFLVLYIGLPGFVVVAYQFRVRFKYCHGINFQNFSKHA